MKKSKKKPLKECKAASVRPRPPKKFLNPKIVAVAKAIREFRVRAKLTQQGLADKTGIQRSNIARIESGRHAPEMITLERIAKAFGITAQRIMTAADKIFAETSTPEVAA